MHVTISELWQFLTHFSLQLLLICVLRDFAWSLSARYAHFLKCRWSCYQQTATGIVVWHSCRSHGTFLLQVINITVLQNRMTGNEMDRLIRHLNIGFRVKSCFSNGSHRDKYVGNQFLKCGKLLTRSGSITPIAWQENTHYRDLNTIP